jgi:hypothetical protein
VIARVLFPHRVRLWLPVQHGGLVAAHLIRIDGHLVELVFLLQAKAST